ncbi:MAG TPA: hypothetical protein DCP75_08175 [Haliea salexigens]|uniref:Uncharacterized protein n=1 Tax=Haliea salexigens TaxID=287487 RepID=A0A3C1KLU3_9GAMM|nr:hypothetical protein [Haliea sp.]HAN27682.1 hypothetical protein [Haliea salexigens]|tara:strand:- start:3453 stop:3737 length:285 start_codon:yes stop_codon:yes gene_type:complete
MNQVCECCGQSLPGDPVQAEADSILEWARDNSVPLIRGDRLRLEDAARYLDRSPGTLRNWLAAGVPLPVVSVNRRHYLPVMQFARFLIQRMDDE